VRAGSSVVVEKLCYKSEGLSPDEVIEYYQFAQSFRPHQALGFTQPLREMSTRSRKMMFLRSRARPVRRADNLAAFC
jgi:hypothetical protein